MLKAGAPTLVAGIVSGFLLLLLLLLLQGVVVVHADSPECGIITFFGLKTAECDNKNLKNIPKNMVRDIKVLKFNDNQLTYLGIDEFKSYAQLQEIYLQRNRISMIAQDAFRGLYNLQILYIEENKLTEVPTAIFDHLISVRILRMSSNPIRYITANAFAKLRNIEELDFSNCWLERVDAKAFNGLPKLSEIDLVNNELKTLSSEMQHSLPPSLTIFRLYRNPWICDCRLRWLRKWITNTEAVNWDFGSNTPTCAGPKLLAGVNWVHLKSEQYACPARITGNSSTSLELEVGGNTTIECVVFGDPEPQITWMRGPRFINKDKVLKRYSVVEGMKQIRSSIVLNEVRKSDAGDYKCIAENSAGRSEVTYKLWVQGEDVQVGGSTVVFTLGTEAILGIAIGSVLLIILLVVCLVFCLRRQDRQNHAYKVKDYKKAPKGTKKDDKSFDEEEDTFDSKEKEKEKTVPTASTELLCDKQTSEKEKEILQDLGEVIHDTVIPENKVPEIHDEPDLGIDRTVQNDNHVPIHGGNKHENSTQETGNHEPVMTTMPVISHDKDLSPEKSEAVTPNEFKMRIFSTYDPHSDERTQLDRRVVTPDDEEISPPRVTPIPPPPPRPVCNSHIKDIPPDLLRDERHAMANHKGGGGGVGSTYPNHIQTTHKRAEENPYAKPSDLKPAAKRHSSSQENLLGKDRPRDHYRDGDRRHGDGSRSSKSKPRSREPSPCTNPVCMANHRHGDTRSSGHCGKPHIKPSRSMEGFHKLEGMLEEEGSPHRSRDDIRGYGDRYRTLPSRPSHSRETHSNSPSKTVTIADPYCYPSATVGLDSPTKSGPPMLRHYSASPQKPGSGRTLQPILKCSSQSHPPHMPGTMSPPSAATLPHQPGPKAMGSRTVGFAEPTYSSPQKPPRTFGTSLDDLLSPPFGNIAADRSKKHLKPKPGDKDDFGTAV